MNCTICHKPITLIPSAAERARKFGLTAEHYTKLFAEHAQCTIDKRAREVSELVARRNMETFTGQVVRGESPEFYAVNKFTR